MAWVEDNYQVSVKYQTLDKEVRYRMKAKLKLPSAVVTKKMLRQLASKKN
jgi:putative transposase